MAKRPTKKAVLRLRLYIVGNAPNSLRAIANAQAICDQHFAAAHEMEVVDLFRHPWRGLADAILVTPTLLKLRPLPVQRLIGDLSDTDQLLRTLCAK